MPPDKTQPLRILLLCRVKQAAGVATIVQKFISGFTGLGHEVIFLKLDSNLKFLGSARKLARIVSNSEILLGKASHDIALCITDEFVWYSLMLRGLLNSTPKIFATVIHPRHYCYKLQDSSRPAEADLVRSKLLASAAGLIFMNDACKRAHEIFYTDDLALAHVRPLPVVDRKGPLDRHPVPGKIVSVGRLVNFKNHHQTLIAELIPLVESGEQIEYWIYGDGPDRPALEEHIQRIGASSFCHVMGNFPYDEFENILRGAWLFVGMGTSAIEAASLGIPTTIPVESRADAVCYGFFGVEYDGLEVGEVIPRLSESKIIQHVERLLATPAGDYSALCEQTQRAGTRFDVQQVCAQYLELFSKSPGLQIGLGPLEFCSYLRSRALRRYSTHTDRIHL